MKNTPINIELIETKRHQQDRNNSDCSSKYRDYETHYCIRKSHKSLLCSRRDGILQ